MKFIYVQNYLITSRETKLEFFAHIGKQTEFRVVNQKIILNDNSLILEIENGTNIEFAKEYINTFFEDYKDITVKIVDTLVQSNEKIVLGFEDKKAKEVRL